MKFEIIGYVWLCFLLGCSQGVPIIITESETKYLGVWQHIQQREQAESFVYSHTLLAINPNGTARYLRCKLFHSQSTATGFAAKKMSKESTLFDDAIITAITSDKIEIEQKADYMNLRQELIISAQPYTENGLSKIGIDDVILVKLEADDIPAKTDWGCPDIDDQDLQRSI